MSDITPVQRRGRVQQVVICPGCLTAATRSQFESSPNREGERCWRCPSRYVLVEIPDERPQTGHGESPACGEPGHVICGDCARTQTGQGERAAPNAREQAIAAGTEAFFRLYEDEDQDIRDALRCGLGVVAHEMEEALK